MTATQKHDIIPVCTTVLSADQQPKEDIMLDQQKITILYCRLRMRMPKMERVTVSQISESI